MIIGYPQSYKKTMLTLLTLFTITGITLFFSPKIIWLLAPNAVRAVPTRTGG